MAPSQWSIMAALGAVYIIWGSTYLAIRFAIETLPPFLMAGTRFLIAGAILYAAMRFSGVQAPKRVHWRSTAIIAALLLFGGNGGVVWAEQFVPSSVTAVIIATTPLWMVLLDWWRNGVRPTTGVVIGLLLGLVGIALLVGQGKLDGGNQINPIGAGVLIFATLSWAVGSFYARYAKLPSAPLLGTGMEMLVGGVLFLIAGSVTGEWGRLRLEQVSLQSLVALGYLIVFGAIVAFSAFTWLLRVTPLSIASTYAYVNPVVAVFLGWALAGETLTLQTLMATVVIVTAIVFITTRQVRRPQPAISPASE
ncbi:MAG: drug/metabolite exporter YedA [Chloroflexi bacterium]|nr:drug/metabolite exporter YedA [Chloroflexota bacterium]